MKITFILPTCEPDEMFKWLLPSLENFKNAKNFVNFAIGFQPPYTESEINTVLTTLDSLGLEYKYFYKNYQVTKPFVPLIRMRNDCSLLYPDSLVYGLLDDDMSFESPEICQYLKTVLDLFLKNNNLGIIALKYPYHVGFANNCFATDLGIFYRGGISYGFKGLTPENLYEFKNITALNLDYKNENLLDLFGGCQDKLCAAVRILNGNEAAILWAENIHHVENRKVRGAIGHKWLAAQEIPGSIIQFIIKYFCANFLMSGTMELADQKIIEFLKENNNYSFINIRKDNFDINKLAIYYPIINESDFHQE